MIRQLMKSRRKFILVDVNTQKDYLLANGNARIRNHRRVLANIRRILAWARMKHIPVISISDIYPDNNGFSEEHFCIEGTEGQKKIHYTLLRNRLSLPADGFNNLPINIMHQYRQVIFHKRGKDPFEEPIIERLLSEVQAGQFILIGADTEGAVKATALGLLQRGKKIAVVIDAVGSKQKKEAEMALRKMKAKGARLIETKKIAGSTHLRCVGVCDCKACRGNTRKTPVEITAK